MMDFIAALASLAAFVGGWLLVARWLKGKGRGWLLRHLVGSSAGVLASFLLVGVLLGVGIIEPVEPTSEVQASVEDEDAEIDSLYSVESDELMAPYKRTVEVRISERLSSGQLEAIAKQIKSNEGAEVERTFIGYRLQEGNEYGPYWATTHYDPELRVIIIGTTAEEQAKLDAEYSGPEQFASLSEMIYELGEFDEGNGTFELLSESPLAFRISQIAMKGQPEEVTYFDNWRAAIYGVYNTFIHTNADEVEVRAVPLFVDGFGAGANSRLLEDQAITLKMTREEALNAVTQLLDVDGLSELKEPTVYGSSWTDRFVGIYFEDNDPGIDKTIAVLTLYCEGSC